MAGKLGAVLDAIVPAALVATIAGTCIAAADYIALISVERFLERWAWLPPGWGESHERLLVAAAILIAVPVMVFIAWWMYRAARESQRDQGEFC